MLASTYKNIEILVGDDGSTDGTFGEISKYSNNPKVRIFRSEKNRGAGAIRNWLLQEAKGEYIALQDADDSCSPERFAKQLAFLEKEKIDVVGTSADLIDSDGVVWGTLMPPREPGMFSWLRQNAMVHASILFRKSGLGKARYYESLRYGEDYYFMTQLYLNGLKFENIPEVLYHYRIDRNRLKKRDLRKNFEILKAKLVISQLFPFYQKALYLLINIPLVLLSVLRGWISRG